MPGALWAREVGHFVGLCNLPVQPMEHHYLITEAIPEIEARDERLPAGIDYEGNMYFRQEGKGMLLGTYEPVATPWSVSRHASITSGTSYWNHNSIILPSAWNLGFRTHTGT